MESKKEPPVTYSCGGRVKVFYAFEARNLVYSLITHENKSTLHGFPENGHFVIKATKALVKTSHPVEGFKIPGTGTLNFGRGPCAPVPTDLCLGHIDSECRETTVKKRQQIEAGETRPVIAEKIKTKNVFAKPFQPCDFLSCSYKAHLPRFLKQDSVKELSDYEKNCNTANVVEFTPPLMLLYGSEYHYRMVLRPISRDFLQDRPTTITIFYGEIYETTNKTITGDGDDYFSGFTPRLFKKEQTGSDSESELVEYESDIDGYDDDISKGEQKDEDIEKETASPDNVEQQDNLQKQ